METKTVEEKLKGILQPRKIAVHDGCGESACWYLYEVDEEDEIIRELDFLPEWGGWVTSETLKKHGFEVRVA